MGNEVTLSKERVGILEGHHDVEMLDDVLAVGHTTVTNVPWDALVAAGYDNHIDMIFGLSEAYPNITMDSDVTVVWYEAKST